MEEFKINNFNNLEKIGNGIFSDAYVYINPKDNKKYIIKKPKNKDAIHSWLELQKRAKDSSDFAYKVNTNKDVLIPRILYINEKIGYSVEECALGVELNKKIMQDISKVKKYNIAKNIALFLNDLHQANPSSKEYPKGIKPFLMGNKNIIKTIKKAGAWRAFKIFLKNSESLLIDDIEVPIHGDIAPRNLFYDKESDKISIIDFGVARISSIYVEFVSIGSNLSILSFPKDFVYDLADFYNELPKPNKKLYVNKDLLIPLISSTSVLRTYPYNKFQQPFIVGFKIVEAINDWNNLNMKQFINMIKLKKEYKNPINLNKIIECIKISTKK